LADEFIDFPDWTIFTVVQGRTENVAHGADIFADYGTSLGQARMGIGLSQGAGHPDNILKVCRPPRTGGRQPEL